MKKLNGGYTKYFNERNSRVGALFQGRYKSIQIQNDAHFLYLPFYIHFNPLDLHGIKWRNGVLKKRGDTEKYLQSYRWSSHLDYLGIKNFPSVTQRNFLLDFYGDEVQYQKKTREILGSISTENVGDVTLE